MRLLPVNNSTSRGKQFPFWGRNNLRELARTGRGSRPTTRENFENLQKMDYFRRAKNFRKFLEFFEIFLMVLKFFWIFFKFFENFLKKILKLFKICFPPKNHGYAHARYLAAMYSTIYFRNISKYTHDNSYIKINILLIKFSYKDNSWLLNVNYWEVSKYIPRHDELIPAHSPRDPFTA